MYYNKNNNNYKAKKETKYANKINSITDKYEPHVLYIYNICNTSLQFSKTKPLTTSATII